MHAGGMEDRAPKCPTQEVLDSENFMSLLRAKFELSSYRNEK